MKQLDSAIMREVDRAIARHPRSLVSLQTPIGTIVYTAPICEEILGYSQDEITGKNFGLYVHPADIPHALLALQDALLNKQSVEVSARVRTKHNGYILVRGFAWRLTDPVTDKIYLLSHSAPVGL